MPLVRFEGAPGEFSQHDFGSVTVRYRSGAPEQVHFFASRLKWSRYAHVVLVPDDQEETLIRALPPGPVVLRQDADANFRGTACRWRKEKLLVA
jgi:hypothetical protein